MFLKAAYDCKYWKTKHKTCILLIVRLSGCKRAQKQRYFLFKSLHKASLMKCENLHTKRQTSEDGLPHCVNFCNMKNIFTYILIPLTYVTYSYI